MTFAPPYPKNSQGQWLFPRDVELRKKLFRERVHHPSHNNLYLLDELAQYLAQPGDIVLDPMAGAGSIMWVARHGIRVWMVELGPYFTDMLEVNRPGFKGDMLIFGKSDCREVLPFPDAAQAVIFSPPYSNELQVRTGHAVYDETVSGAARGIEKFTYKDRRNLGNMKEFQFNQAMQDVYEKCFKSTKPGGALGLIIKDRMEKGRRIGYGVHHVRLATRAGYKLDEWHQREAIGAVFGHFNLKRGIKQITDEHVIVMRKEIGKE